MTRPPKMTYATGMVLHALDRGWRYGFDIIEATGLRSGTVYPLLRRFEDARLVRSKWEPVRIARKQNRPPRKYYELTAAADEMLSLARERFPATQHLPAAPSVPESANR